MKSPKRAVQIVLLFTFGGVCYGAMEILWRGFTHWTMAVLGGVCFVVIGVLNSRFREDMPLCSRMVISTFVISTGEFITGVIVNICLNWSVWDYSLMPYNIFGQVCLKWCMIWFWLSLVAIVLDSWLRYKWFGASKPRYRIF